MCLVEESIEMWQKPISPIQSESRELFHLEISNNHQVHSARVPEYVSKEIMISSTTE
jgi:hypothetical protein